MRGRFESNCVSVCLVSSMKITFGRREIEREQKKKKNRRKSSWCWCVCVIKIKTVR